jgi:hypothetical protein
MSQTSPPQPIKGGAGRGRTRRRRSMTVDVTTVELFVPGGENDGRWLRNFLKWMTLKGGAGRHSTASSGGWQSSSAAPLGAPFPPSLPPLPKGWVQDQRAQYQVLMQGERSAMMRNRAALLGGSGFVWEARKGRGSALLADNGIKDGVQLGNAGRTAATVHATGGQKSKQKDGKMGKRAKLEPMGGTSSSGNVKNNAQSSAARKMSTTVQHARERRSKRKDGMIRKSAKLGPTTQSTGCEPGRSMINDGSPGRKSSQKSPPMQFYHSLLLGNWSKVGGGAPSGDQSSDPTTSKSSQMIPDLGVSLDCASPTAESKKRKHPSPSKRTSPSPKGDFRVGSGSEGGEIIGGAGGGGICHQREWRGTLRPPCTPPPLAIMTINKGVEVSTA